MPRSLMLAALLICAFAPAALAQPAGDPAPQPPQSSGPMRLEKVHNGFVIAPDFKVAQIDHTTGELAGAYGGWLFDQHLLVGGAGYGLTHHRDSVNSLGYGGAVIGWQQQLSDWFGFDVKGLVGGGRATLTTTADELFTPFGRDRHPIPTSMRDHMNGIIPVPNARFRFREDFFVFEPQADLVLTLTDHIGLSVGGGYRVVGQADGVESRLRGATGSVALRITGGTR
jgi:hypothetical protein